MLIMTLIEHGNFSELRANSNYTGQEYLKIGDVGARYASKRMRPKEKDSANFRGAVDS